MVLHAPGNPELNLSYTATLWLTSLKYFMHFFAFLGVIFVGFFYFLYILIQNYLQGEAFYKVLMAFGCSY